MSRAIDIHLSQLRFPSTCVVCMSPSCKNFKLQKIIAYGRQSFTLTVNVPMCRLHFQSATCRGKAETLVGTLAPVIAMVAGLFSTIVLLVQWQGKVLLNLFTASMFGIVIFLALWAVISIVLAPLFATSAAKKARHAVRMRRYWYQDQFVRLEFQNEQLAETVLFGK